jgi:vacuolar-type H+-ATPase subunit I/STV1
MVQALVVLGFLLMLYNTYTGFQMKSKAPGGVIGERLTQLNLFILLFALGYLAVALLTWSRPVDTLLLIVSLILFFGAVFVLLVLRLVQAVLAALEG